MKNMILLCHIVFAIALASKIQNPVLAVLVAFLSHYFLDLFPHIEYPINNLKHIKTFRNYENSFSHKSSDRYFYEKKKEYLIQKKYLLIEILYLIFDFLIGIFSIFIFTDRSWIFFLAAFVSILPDGITILSAIAPNKILKIHNKFHREKIHFLKHKNIPIFWQILTQILAVIISIIILKI